ncbi:hypothetical protein CO115_02205 [Candidatus Falkowbacteria bacterium CG_4_9_14_3_um_filter_36_9]|uniref:Polymerase beta nucleotidyltransferase domain-containing protein n=1 Tax=Candidatus Falkowbacteria bacterium CG02_land_8_20_14_3_00_36_14 TaxID=1974560 RepID=A0A2M7DQH0_9BACT|nr:MAG: hypothetical protein COS18_01090 [Candidatus Falkowbacteria bacterium CG02_land_8_20_14_3_00_36_14]PIX10835.1 MAG: hypothetical protein COZ73_04560 [Candidatus Falkowbacteria bacterium CG_4_8_14_3_um_filter_36_11]PJA11337.1 MAG: hypothetical protein COX67_00390 [Candidatus Falkowbacteria bacterium CG_4_10_14_0_2_um_filter_36_22]PJB19812.1 MAG: hypothetical protein CO115_02205 [Candidatus Falkowbacteria bacterium CG_4_9_14_3_um_filter_36_9]
MKKIEELKEKIIPILKANDVVRSSVFGSFARGEDTPESDIDLLVELEDNKSLLDMVHLKNELEDFLRRKVDIITYDSVNPRLKDYIFRDEIKIYGQRQ